MQKEIESNLQKLAEKIAAIRRQAEELQAIPGGIQAVDKNVDRILASVKMLEINISDLAELG